MFRVERDERGTIGRRAGPGGKMDAIERLFRVAPSWPGAVRRRQGFALAGVRAVDSAPSTRVGRQIMPVPNIVVLAFGGLFVVVIGAVVANRITAKKLSDLRARGLYPPAGQESDAEVRRWLAAGEKIMAIRCYRLAHKVGLKEAKDAVEELERTQL